ncbi:hypothetical protein FOQG_10007 [Fusarium oxysporum f. sp. raphani 54005]|uniref:Uncharacterized protein n=7 Tax=Fusarium oxysporum TaxID=5507 RepID=W9HW61_FUSOX|nr:hypothetical protein FOYG_12323 [Fusarium oxysporum NRRL 32931]EWZ35481.1 hypothetical protein FOZG_11397 [Fusarium oxysporum Fo47]EWZ96521.1 hypothetical protein FOWG_03884 [Fusarium oxysporum f. sp. lycopersici MN25]EXA37608.1 hypothetical protein FOVG_11753 [Fusarium oxysporum f. sp. pisi HDV247]EXK35150.1 hypothetical protein FOMG_10373 [Fusarium oxysporum f. sp. melonis 26406]EXK86373.1 hypothetical protein FOQG_10007 [Fusarium oxysporum f. sp. raphani 54005]EXL55020.1 hypothetical pr
MARFPGTSFASVNYRNNRVPGLKFMAWDSKFAIGCLAK